MIIKLFEIQNNTPIASEHCYILKELKDVMTEYPNDYMKIYQYIFYMTCPNPDLNPFFNVSEEDKEEHILKQVDLDISLDSPVIENAITLCHTLYNTATSRAFLGAKTMLDKISVYLSTTSINANSKDGNGTFILNAMKNLTDMRLTYKNAEKDLIEEQGRLRGDSAKAYDQQ